MITGSKLVKGGLFSSSYVSFTIVVKPLGYTVERRFNDFLWLRNILSREYPGIYVKNSYSDSSYPKENWQSKL